jgi:opacity protein-like surface antigen
MKRLIPLAIVLLFGAATTTHAFYFGASYLNTNAEFDRALDNFDTDDSAYKFYAWYRAFRFVDLEATYRDLGAHVDMTGVDRVAVDLEAYDVAARGVIPLGNRLSIFGRVGYANVSREGTLDLDGVVSSIDTDDWELTYGAGAEFKLGQRFGLRAEWEEYDVDETLNSFSAGAFFRF